VGTLAGGVYTRKGSFQTRRWTDIAVGRDSMALYDRKTGRLTTGTFRNGVWKSVKTQTIRAGYTHVVASCDSILFYRRSTGVGLVAELSAGGIRDKREVALTVGRTLLEASCDTLLSITPGSPAQQWALGTLKDGTYQPTSTAQYAVAYTRLATDTGSFLVLAADGVGPDYGFWGSLVGGARAFVGESAGFGSWRIIAGAADSVLFYEPSYGVYTGTLKNGVYTSVGQAPGTFRTDLTIIAGGK
jgi:hypothetical protein